MDRELRFAIIGAGMAGILAAIELEQKGLDDFTIYEKADRVGGTWRENTYPGIACDVPSHLYSYSFALNPGWSHTYSPGAEIQSYFERVAAEKSVVGRVRFGDEVVKCQFDGGLWQLETAQGHRAEVDVVIAATGVLHHPRYPDIEGLDTFGGAAFHSARWDHGVAIEGARVGIVGTGSSAVQITSAIVGHAERVSLFQRTAQWIMPIPNPAYDEEQRREFGRDAAALRELYDGLSEIFDAFSDGVVDADSEAMHRIEEACLANLEDNVTDPDLRERLRPSYRAACKRLIVSPDFYDAIQRPNAELVTSHIDRVEREGVRTADGRLHELDVLVLATGFKVDAFMRPMHIKGRNGRDLDEAWTPRPEAYLSISVPEFPNLFMLNGPNGPVGNFSLIQVAELQMGYILQLVRELRSGRSEVSPTPEALARFEADRLEASRHTIWSTGCRSWYLDDRGVPMVWPWPFSRFREAMAKPDLADYELR